ncbi:MAG TPA: hypothetical protein VGF53_11535 [Pseudolabrys sp.]|jgi:hypothetical protein
MSDRNRGQTWPLSTIFVLTLVGGIVGVIAKAMGYTFETGVVVVLLIVAAEIALILYLPPLYLMSRVLTAGAVATQIDDIRNALLGAQGNQDQIAALSAAVTGARTQITNLDARFNDNGDVAAKLKTISDGIAVNKPKPQGS